MTNNVKIYYRDDTTETCVWKDEETQAQRTYIAQNLIYCYNEDGSYKVVNMEIVANVTFGVE